MILLLFESIQRFPDQSSPYSGKIRDVRNILLTRTIASITAHNIIDQLFVFSASLTLFPPTVFYDFLSYEGGIFIPHPRKQC